MVWSVELRVEVVARYWSFPGWLSRGRPRLVAGEADLELVLAAIAWVRLAADAYADELERLGMPGDREFHEAARAVVNELALAVVYPRAAGR